MMTKVIQQYLKIDKIFKKKNYILEENNFYILTIKGKYLIGFIILFVII